MKISTGSKTCFYLTLTNLALAPHAFAGENDPSQPYPSCWGYGVHGHSFWWIVPLMFFVLIIFLIMRKGRGCMWCNRMMGGNEFRDSMNQSQDIPSGSAMEILNQRYVKGEIDKQEYEEKKAAISTSD